jgi:alpha-L-fucosidase
MNLRTTSAAPTYPFILALLVVIVMAAATAARAEVPLPTASQAEWVDAGIGIFVHWGPHVYQHSEGDDLSTPRTRINPDRFDAAQIARAAKSANARYLVFTAKHVGGYCAWQTATTDYSLKTSPWRGGKGDMVGDLAQACRQEGLRFGVYLSPRSNVDQAGTGGHARNAERQKAYNEVYRRQLTEILTGYGPMFEMWFDGGNIVPVNDLIDKLAPEIITFQGRRPGSTRWVGTEHGFAPYPCWNTIDWTAGATPRQGAGSPSGNIWCPAECDVSILRPNWFWKPGSDKRVLSLNALIEIYYMSVGRGVNLLLNITPDDHGAIPAAQVRRLTEFGDEINARFAKPLATTQGSEIKFARPTKIDHLRLREDIRHGERVREFTVEGRGADGRWSVLYRGTQIGARQIVPLPAVEVTGMRLKVTQAAGSPRLRDFAVYFVDRPVPQAAFR